MTLPVQAWQIAKGGYQCWGLEFRGQGGTAAPPGNLVDVYLHDLVCVMATLSLRGTYTDVVRQPDLLVALLVVPQLPLEQENQACCCNNKLFATSISPAG